MDMKDMDSYKPAHLDYHPVEEIWNALTHGVGAVLALAGAVVLVVIAALYGDVWSVTGAAVYGTTMVVLFLASTLYQCPEAIAAVCLQGV